MENFTADYLSREDFGDMLVMSDGNVLYFNTSDWYQYLPTITSYRPQLYQSALDKNGRVAIIPEKDMTGQMKKKNWIQEVLHIQKIKQQCSFRIRKM